jgi:hypothetical protein
VALSPQKERHVRLAAAVILVGVGALLFFPQAYPFPIRAFGIILITVAGTVARSRSIAGSPVHASPELTYRERQVRNFKKTWPFGTVVAVALGSSFYLLHLDAIGGGNQIFPVIAFAAMGLLTMGYIAYLGTAQ